MRMRVSHVVINGRAQSDQDIDKDCKATHSTLCMCIQQQLHSFGESDPVVLSGSCPEPESSNQEIFLLGVLSGVVNVVVNVDRNRTGSV